jgi:hypothetical protein
MYDDSSRNAFDERGQYERYVIDMCVRRLQQARGIVSPLTIEISDSGPTGIRMQLSESFGANYAADVVLEFVPLTLLAGFKTLDMIIEWCLEQNAINGRLSFAEKIIKCRDESVHVWPDFLETDAHLRNVVIESYAAVRRKRNAIVHGRWGQNVVGTLEFDYWYTDDLSPLRPRPRVRDEDRLPGSVTLAFAEFAALLSRSLVTPSTQTNRVLSALRRLSNQFRTLHGLVLVDAGPEHFYRIVRLTHLDTVDFDEIVPVIKEVQTIAGDVRYDLVINRGAERWTVPASETCCLNGKIQLSDLERFKGRLDYD